jgi:hypothetical protein
MSGGEIIAIVAIVCVFTVFGVTWSMSIRAQVRARELLHAERQAAIEKGLPLPEEPSEPGEPSALPTVIARKPEAHSLKMGIFWLFLGLGVILALRLADPSSPRWAWGIVLVAVGLADLAYWVVRGKAEDEAAREAGSK